MKSGIYQIINLRNGYSYIGSSIDIPRRFTQHKSTLRHQCHANRYLQRAWNQDGSFFEFRILTKCQANDLIHAEQHWIDTLAPEYNFSRFAEHPVRGVQVSDITRAKISVQKSGKSLSEAHRLNLSSSKRGKKPTIEARRNAQLGQIAKSRLVSAYQDRVLVKTFHLAESSAQGFSYWAVYKCLYNKQKQHKGFTFQYVGDELG